MTLEFLTGRKTRKGMVGTYSKDGRLYGKKFAPHRHEEYCEKCGKYTAHKATIMGYKCKHCGRISL